MFKVRKSLTCWWPVTVREPHPENPGAVKESTFEVEFLILGRAQRKAREDQRQLLIKALSEASGEEAIKEASDALRSFADGLYAEAICNWRGIEGDGGDFVYSEDHLALLLDSDFVRKGLDEAFNEAITLDKARLGN